MLSFELRDSGTQRRLDNAKALQRSNNLLYCQITPMTMQVADSKVISSSTNYLSVTGLSRHRLKNNSELFNRIAKELIKLNPNVLQMDGIQIRLTCCFDIGIACGSYGTTCNLSKSELMKLVNEK